MLNWINFLHIYQPPHQNEYTFHKVAKESYYEIARFFDLYDGIRLTMNISGSLLEQLERYHYNDLLARFVRAFSDGEMELVGSGMYHPILPLLPGEEIERQIILDEEIKKRIFGAEYRRGGFYLPEMAYSRKVAEVLDRMGFSWIILDEISLDGKLGGPDKSSPYRIKGLDLKVVFRSRDVSEKFVPEKIKELSASCHGESADIITATDGELYGHHHQDFYNKTKEVFTDGNIRSLKVSEFIESFGKVQIKEADPIESCWASGEKDLGSNPFSYWKDPDNRLQAALWDFADFAIKEMRKHREDENYPIARSLLDKALSSCHFWAASGKASKVWKETIWNPDMVESGAQLLVRSMRSLRKMDMERRMDAERRFSEISTLLWQMHWSKFYNS